MISVRLPRVRMCELVFMRLSGACTGTSDPSHAPPQPYPPSSEEPEKPVETSARNPKRSFSDDKPMPPGEPDEPKLSSTLTRGSKPARQRGRGFDDAGLNKGEKAINFTLRDIHGRELTLSRLLSQKPAVIVFGSFT